MLRAHGLLRLSSSCASSSFAMIGMFVECSALMVFFSALSSNPVSCPPFPNRPLAAGPSRLCRLTQYPILSSFPQSPSCCRSFSALSSNPVSYPVLLSPITLLLPVLLGPSLPCTSNVARNPAATMTIKCLPLSKGRTEPAWPATQINTQGGEHVTP